MVTKYDLTEDMEGNIVITPVPESHNGRFVSVEDYDALAAENAAIRHAITFATAPDMWVDKGYDHFEYRYQEWYVDVLNASAEIPATAAALAAIQAQGVEKALAVVSACRENICPGGLSENRQYEESIVKPHLDGITDELENLIIELREGK